jgi:eukaryotic-like serine/threonine-protein kinase
MAGSAPRRHAASAEPLTGWAAAGMVAAGAAVVLAGALGGWTITRFLAGQPPLTTVNVTSASTSLRQHNDGLGFTLPVPQDWTEYRDEPPEGVPTVNFISTDGTEGLAVQQAESTEKAQAVAGTVLDELMVSTNASPEAVQLRYESAERTSWRRIVPASTGVWTVTLTVPRVAAGSTSAGLFARIADGFSVSST